MAVPKIVTNVAYSKYESKLEKEVLKGPMPRHVGVIMDGNRRYAKEVLKTDNVSIGHKLGKKKVEEVANWCVNTKIKVLTIYAFSTENFNRDKKEVDFLLSLIRAMLDEVAKDENTHKHKIRVKVIGDRSMLPDDLMEAVRNVEEVTKDYDDYHFNIAVAYGGRQEIVTAIKKIAERVKDGTLNVEDIDESMISSELYTSDDPDPDLILRTSGELRISNFLIWQLAYSELYFTDVYWPGFRYIDFLRAIRSYQQRSRRYGV